ncbi:putative F420-0 ABC transporter substrate-binding protein [Mycetocola manganoxydans]|uniref:Putative F420-0 ABC transporter substrate-binding protein n=1 Tax=Mycetocola manganoxydans TaxID=699879 RepID=A0A3L6ZYZ0_9MICO|nr:putative F420-0 ABC transporter substrate-binding protein [Mycetocola manganoxydans]RLP72948.1 putative F420-0 ABC transporter substrate-binding protein [Mycetocola manganoxydans]GHD44870.1 lipoprotein [Mycetocola manganoxydans]
MTSRSPFTARRILPRRVLAAAGLLTGLAALTGCTAAPVPEPSDSREPTASAYPLTIDNCGTELTIEKAPERVLTIKSTSTEMMLALGLEDRLIGHAFPDGPIPDELGGEDVPVISDKVPGQEAVLTLEPDFIFAGWESNFSADGAGDRDSLAELGVNTYVSPAACQSAEKPAELRFEDVFDQIAEVGSIFGADEEATALIAEQRTALGELTAAAGTTALWYSSGSDTPFVGAGAGAPQMIMDAIGIENIAAGVNESWTSFNWEAVVDANPDVIILVESDWGTAEKKIGVLRSNPATAKLDAVVNERFITVPFAATEAGVRNVEAAQIIAEQLEALGL